MMNSRILSILLLVMAGSGTNLVAQWYDVKGNLPTWGVGDAIDACDSLTAVVAVRSGPPHALYLTTNGGNTWNNRSIPFMWGAYDVSLVDSSHVWAVTGGGHIYGTTDGGRNWTLQFYDTTVTTYMDYIEMFSQTDGVAVGDARPGKPIAILRTTNGGTTWTQMNHSSLVDAWSGDNWRRMDFANINVGYLKPSNVQNSRLVKTTDGGATWTETGTDVPFIQVLKFFDERIGLAASDPDVFRTTDGGETWEEFTADTQVSNYHGMSDHWGNDIEFLPGDASKVRYTAGDTLMFSSDTGRTWTVDQLNIHLFSGRDIVNPDQHCGWFLCDNGHVYRTLNPDRVTTGVQSAALLPLAYYLSQNYPNPFNPSTTIRYCLPQRSHVTLTVYNSLGQQVAILVNGEQEPGYHEVKLNGTNLASGVYFYRMQASSFVETRKLFLIK